MSLTPNDYKTARQISQILTQYYIEGCNQAEIAQRLGLSTAKVNRLLKQAREQGLVEVIIHTPYQHLFEMERRLKVTGIKEAVVIPQLAEDPQAIMQAVGRAGADYLLQHLRDGDTICMGGGKTLQALVQAVEPDRQYEVQVVPAIGGVQGTHHTDVNYLVAELARRLGGKAYQLHAPAFVDSPEARRGLLSLRQVGEILEMARRARIALVGVGSVGPISSSYFQFTSLDVSHMKQIVEEEHGAGEILAHVYNSRGMLCAPQYAARVVGLEWKEWMSIPLVIGVAATKTKVLPILGALRGKLLTTLITDESAALHILDLFERETFILEEDSYAA
jgi:DNA-binding transcriptional regulator LsrR (DeoR family)